MRAYGSVSVDVSNELFFAIRVGWFCASIPGVLFAIINLRRALKTRSLVRAVGVDGARSLMAEQTVVVEANRFLAQVILGVVGLSGVAQGLGGAVEIWRGIGSVGIIVVIVLLTFSSAYSYVCGIALDRFIEAARTEGAKV